MENYIIIIGIVIIILFTVFIYIYQWHKNGKTFSFLEKVPWTKEYKDRIQREKEENERQLKIAEQKVNKISRIIEDSINWKYLNYSKFQKLYTDVLNIYNETKSFHKIIKEKFSVFFACIENPKFADEHNEEYINNEKNLYADYFKKLDEKWFWLTEKQLEAIFTDEDSTLINAWAWTWKTKTIENKMLYLHLMKWVPLDDILVITYSKASQQDMLKRIINTLRTAWIEIDEKKLPQTISTFHAFGKRIVDEYTAKYWSFSDEEKLIWQWFVGKKVLEEKEQDEIITLVMDRMKKNPELQQMLSDYLLYYNSPEYAVEDFDTLNDYYNRIRRSYSTLIVDSMWYTETVKSYWEVLIANYLVSHWVKVEYEPKWHFYTNDEWQKRAYKPDFYLPDYDIYIEYFWIDKNWNTAPYIATENYIQRMKQKIQNHKISKNKLIDMRYSDYQNWKRYFLDKLESQLNKYNVELKPQSTEENITLLEWPLWWLENILKTFLALYKESSETISSLREKIQTFDSLNIERNIIFLDIFENYLNWYNDLLLEWWYMDFWDMICDSNEILESWDVKRKFSYILVDEFQDISEARAMLVKNLIKDHNETRLFCVWDDWQSIYRFAGSNTNIFLKFEDYFWYTKKITLDKTFRFNQWISDVSWKFVMENPEQTKKHLDSNDKEENDKILVLQRDWWYWIYNSIIHKICEDVFDNWWNRKEISLMYLTRYSLRKYAKRHDKDFIKFLMESFKAEKQYEQKDWKTEEYYITDTLTYWEHKFKLKVRPLTIHKAKWLEADYVVVDYVNQNDDYNFPSSFDDDPVLELILEASRWKFIFSEERRLFYVAMTRWKKLAFLTYSWKKQSLFLKELLKIGENTVDILNTWGQNLSLLNDYEAPKCGNCWWALRISKYDRVYTEYYCENFAMWCDSKYFKFRNWTYRAPTCPWCWIPMMLRQNSKNHRPFRWCTDYPACKWTREFRWY